MKILLIITDEESWLCFNDKHQVWRNQLPSWRYFQEQGLTFPNHYTASCACAPSRASLYTGKFPNPNCTDYDDPNFHNITSTNGFASDTFTPLNSRNMAEYFKAYGFVCHYFGKWHLTPEADNADLAVRGWTGTIWSGPEPHGPELDLSGMIIDAKTLSLACQVLDDTREQDNVIYAVNFVNPHDINLYLKLKALGMLDDLPLPDIDVSCADDTITDNNNPNNKVTKLEQLMTRYMQEELYCSRELFEAYFDVTEYRRFYLYLCQLVDQHIMTLLSHVDSQTVVIRTSDHGSAYGTKGGLLGKWLTTDDRVIRVPLMMANLPGNIILYNSFVSKTGSRPNDLITAKRVYNQLSSSVDILPTMMGLAGIPHHQLPGVNLFTRARSHVDFVTFDNPTAGEKQLRLYERHQHQQGEDANPADLHSYSAIPFYGLHCRISMTATTTNKVTTTLNPSNHFKARL